MKIKICCEDMRFYIDKHWIEYNGEDAVIDTSLYEENEIEIEHCPFCGKKIKIII